MPVNALSRRSLVALSLGALLLLPLPAFGQDASLEPSAAPSPLPISSVAPLATSPDGSWTVEAFDPWEQGLIEPRPGSELALALLGGGRLEGETGCGRFNGGWSLEDGRMRMGVSPTGYLDCGEKQTEEAIGFAAALDAVAAWEPTSAGIELLDATGATRIVLGRETVVEPTGSWDVVRYRRPNGKLTRPPADGSMRLELGSDGAAAGSTGCRLLEGVYSREGGGIIIGPLETVGLPCEGADGKAERQLLRALGEVVYWERDGDTLALHDGFDELLVELVLTPEPVETAG